jgi:hypothetical protein
MWVYAEKGQGMSTKPRFSDNILAAIRKGMIIGLQAGSQPHRFIALWAVVVEGRVFVRSWSLKPRSWHKTFLHSPVIRWRPRKPFGRCRRAVSA